MLTAQPSFQPLHLIFFYCYYYIHLLGQECVFAKAQNEGQKTVRSWFFLQPMWVLGIDWVFRPVAKCINPASDILYVFYFFGETLYSFICFVYVQLVHCSILRWLPLNSLSDNSNVSLWFPIQIGNVLALGWANFAYPSRSSVIPGLLWHLSSGMQKVYLLLPLAEDTSAHSLLGNYRHCMDGSFISAWWTLKVLPPYTMSLVLTLTVGASHCPGKDGHAASLLRLYWHSEARARFLQYLASIGTLLLKILPF